MIENEVRFCRGLELQKLESNEVHNVVKKLLDFETSAKLSLPLINSLITTLNLKIKPI